MQMRSNIHLALLFKKIPLSSLTMNQRYWYRARLNSPQINWSSTYSFKNIDRNFSWFIDKDFNLNDLTTTNVEFDSTEFIVEIKPQY